MATATELRLSVGETTGDVSALLVRPPDARLLYVLAHGAGAGMRHPFLESIAQRLAEQGIATLRYQFPYMERRSSRPDSPAVAAAAVRAAVAEATRVAPGLPLIAGGKSFGGRMTSTAQAEERLPGVRGLVFLGFPLHPPGRPDDKRAEHLGRVQIPMLFLQGDRDEFADLKLLRPVVKQLGERATLHLVEGGDHSFKVLKRSGKTDTDVMTELAQMIVDWTNNLADEPPGGSLRDKTTRSLREPPSGSSRRG
jgi:predicted alpha/beta-hydrolase family hydrolase